MKKEDIAVLAHLLSAMKDAVSMLESAEKNNDLEKANLAKREILNLQKQLDQML